MHDSDRSSENDPDVTVEFLLSRARQLDPATQEAAVRRFWAEIEEARHALESPGAHDEPLPAAYDPAWIEGSSK